MCHIYFLQTYKVCIFSIFLSTHIINKIFSAVLKFTTSCNDNIMSFSINQLSLKANTFIILLATNIHGTIQHITMEGLSAKEVRQYQFVQLQITFKLLPKQFVKLSYYDVTMKIHEFWMCTFMYWIYITDCSTLVIYLQRYICGYTLTRLNLPYLIVIIKEPYVSFMKICYVGCVLVS